MNPGIGWILVLLGVIFMGIRAFNVGTPPWVHLGWAGATLVVIGAVLVGP